MEIVGIGTDLVDLDRMRQVLERTPSFATRVFTEGEQALAASRSDPVKPLAARFAAKEAVMKSLGVGLGEVNLIDIEVLRAESGAPSIVLHGSAVDVAAARGVDRFLVSLSHSDTTAIAMVVAQRDG
jgi:holo-[acyl-carrier protein] synthase